MTKLETIKQKIAELKEKTGYFGETAKKAAAKIVATGSVLAALSGAPQELEAKEQITATAQNAKDNEGEQDSFDVRTLNEYNLLKVLLFLRPYHKEYSSTTNDIGASLPHLFIPTGKNNEYYDLLLYLGDEKLKSYKSKKNSKENALDAVKNIVKNMSTFDLLKQSELFFEQQTSSKIYKECRNLYAQLDSKYEFTEAQKTVFFVLYYLNSEDLKTVLNGINKNGNDNTNINTIFAELAHKKTKTEDIAILYWLNALYVDMISFDTISEMKVSSFETAITGGQRLTFQQFINKVFYDGGAGKFKLNVPNIHDYVKTAKSKNHKTKAIDKNGKTPYIGNIVDNAIKNETLRDPKKEQEKQKWTKILANILQNTKNIKKYIINLDSPLLENIDVKNKAEELSKQQIKEPDTKAKTAVKQQTTKNDPYKIEIRSGRKDARSTDKPKKLTKEEETKISKIEAELKKEIKKYENNLNGKVFDLSNISSTTNFIEKTVLPKTFPLIIIRNYFYETQFYGGGYDTANVLTSFGGLTWLLNDLTLSGTKLKNPTHLRTLGKSSIFRAKAWDFFWSLSYEQQLNQVKLFLKLSGGNAILGPLIDHMKGVNNDVISHKKHLENEYNIKLNKDDIKNAVSPTLLLSDFKAAWQLPRNGREIFLRLSPFGGKETADYAFAQAGEDEIGTLKRLFWLYLDAKGKIDIDIYLNLSVDGIAYLLDAFVKSKCEKIGKPVKTNNPKMKDYINAGVFKELKQPIPISKAYRDRGEKKIPNRVARYSFTTNDNLITEIITFAKKKSAKDQKSRTRNTILRQIAYDLYINNMSVKEFFNTGTNVSANLNPVQKILFERVRCQEITNGIEARNARKALIKYTREVLKKVTDPQTKQLLEKIIKDESARIGEKAEQMRRSTEGVKMAQQLHEQQVNRILNQFNGKGRA